MHSGVSYNQITKNVPKALLLGLDLLCLICQRASATSLAELMSFSLPHISVWACVSQSVVPDHPAGTIKGVH